MRPFFLLSLLSLAELSWAASSNTTCTATFTPVTAADAFASLNPGWNLGNTLDATPDEGDWGNAPVVPATLSEIQAKGFKSVRIPSKSKSTTTHKLLIIPSHMGLSLRGRRFSMDRQLDLDGPGRDCR